MSIEDMVRPTLGFGVIGCGQIGRRHLAVIAGEERCRLEAFCDSDDSVLQRMALDYPQATAHREARELLRCEAVQIVSICTPHISHAPLAIAAAEAGKHVLVEKPMALTSADSRRMIEAARANGVQLFVVKQNRFNDPILKARKAIEENRLGRIYMVQANVFWNRRADYYRNSSWRGLRLQEGGALHTQASHFLDLLVWWFGPLEEAKTLLATLHHDIEIEDCGVSALRFESGALGSLCWTTTVYNANFEGSITIIGENGTIRIGGPYLNEIVHWDVCSYPMPEAAADPDLPNDYGTYTGSSANHHRLIAQLAQRVIEGRGAMVEGQEGLLSIEAIEKIYAGA